jgi:hypothetical protein
METNTEITIDPSVLKERTASYSSLTDINGADVFTDSFQGKAAQFKEQKNLPYTTVQEKVFIKSLENSTDVYEQVRNSMFTSSEINVVKDNSAKAPNGMGFAIPIIGIAFVIVIIIMIRYVDERRRKWKNHDVNTYAYE